MTFDTILLFRDIVASRSFSRAAKMSGISQSAASQQIQELERSLKVSLLDRTRRPLVVTAAGELVAAFCEDLLKRRQELDVALAGLRDAIEGTVRIASIYSIGISELVHLEKQFRDQHPQVEVVTKYLQPAKVNAAVLGGQADIGLVSYPEATPELIATPWRKEDMVVAAAPDHPLAKVAASLQAPLPVEELNGIDFIGFDEELPIGRHVERFFKEKGVKVNVTLRFDNIEMVKEAVAHKVGVGILPYRSMREDIRQKRLTAIRLAGGGLQRPIGVIRLKKNKLSKASQAFLDLLMDQKTAETVG
ncbi:MAG: LysR family transcriptional regulator [Acidobacteriota bacterium]